MSELMNRQSLKERLIAYWNSQEVDRDRQLDENAANLAVRGKLASFIPEGSRILDVACGTCANRDWFAPRGTYFATDISIGYLRLGKRLGGRLACADAEQLPFADRSFDVVSLTYALEHTVDPKAVLQELCRVAGERGRVLLVGPSWDFPFWYPTSLRTQAAKRSWLLQYTMQRTLGQIGGWLFGRLPFLIVPNPDAFHLPFEADADAVYVTWSYEVIRQMERLGFHLIRSEVDDRLFGTRWMVKALKQILIRLPPYRLAGSTVMLVFERKAEA